MKLCAIPEGLDPVLLGAGIVMLTCDPSAYVTVVVVEPSVLVTLWLVSPEPNGSFDALDENGLFVLPLPPIGEFAPPRSAMP